MGVNTSGLRWISEPSHFRLWELWGVQSLSTDGVNTSGLRWIRDSVRRGEFVRSMGLLGLSFAG